MNMINSIGKIKPILSSSYLYYTNGSSLTGFTVVNATVSSTVGNPTSSYQVIGNISGGAQYAYINPGSITSLADKTIKFDVYIGSLCNFFLCNSSGKGYFLRLDARGASSYSGFGTSTSFSSWSAPTSGYQFTANTWYTIKIQITSAGSASYYINGSTTAQVSGYTMSSLSNYIAIHGDTGGGTSYFDNIYVYSGLV
jgi:hypothetical protein